MPVELKDLFERALYRSGKSTALNPLTGLVAALLTAAVVSSRWGDDKWLVVLFAALAVIVIGVYLWGFIYFARTNSDALRSEKFTIQKLAIDKGIVGDDITGYMKIAKVADLPTLTDIPSKSEVKGNQ